MWNKIIIVLKSAFLSGYSWSIVLEVLESATFRFSMIFRHFTLVQGECIYSQLLNGSVQMIPLYWSERDIW